MNQAPDIDILAAAGLLAKNWRDKFPHGASPIRPPPCSSCARGTPKRSGTGPTDAERGRRHPPQPEDSGNGRYTYLAAWGYKQDDGTEAGARASSSPSCSPTFRCLMPAAAAQPRPSPTRHGDVLVTFENEAILIEAEVGGDQFESSTSLSIAAAPPVAVVDAVVDRRGTRRSPRPISVPLRAVADRRSSRSTTCVRAIPP